MSNSSISLPLEFLSRMQSLLGDEFDDFFRSYRDPPVVGLRANSLKISGKELQSRLPFSLVPVPWAEDGFVVQGEARPGKHPYHAAGLYYLQDPAAMAVGILMNPKPGERVLDIAAAPGGKSTHIASLMKNQGILIANDLYSGRAKTLANNLDRWGATNVIVTNESPRRLIEKFGAIFDKVLVDAPCSGEGMFRKDQKIRNEWSSKLVSSYANRQDSLLHESSCLVKPGGFLVYATCTFSPMENEGTISRFLHHHPDFKLIDVPHFEGFARGSPEWVDDGKGQDALRNCLRLYPHRIVGEGHFIAVLKKDSTPGDDMIRWKYSSYPKLSGEARNLFDKFVSETFKEKVCVHRQLTRIGNAIYAVPEGSPELSGLRVVRHGWWLGTLKKNRFEPSHALAMAIDPSVVKRSLLLNSGDPLIMTYLHGGIFPSKGENGWVLVAVDGYSLGWGKRVKGRLKSRSPKWFHWI